QAATLRVPHTTGLPQGSPHVTTPRQQSEGLSNSLLTVLRGAMNLAVLFEGWTVTSKRCLATDASHQSGGRFGVCRGGGRVGAGRMPSLNPA
ncbi:hypothetical protein ACFYO0_13075, partial [Streptomyces sp. NPDC006365]|uniref:hypothetical protein n=1 Tax=Streptomyces sp. NPDC006365 TaxID=3364744 RepID=UPI0036CBC225